MNLAESAQRVVEQLKDRGVRLSDSSRLARFSARFATNVYLQPTREEELLEGLVAMRDVQEIALILERFPEISTTELGRLVEDHPIPRLDRSTPGRDRQLELLCGAICRRGGMLVELDREPDLWCQAAGAWIGLAVKRVRSAKRFMANLEKAAEQIQRSDLFYGLAVMDCSLAWNPEMAALVTRNSPEQTAAALRERLDRLLGEHDVGVGKVVEKFPKMLGHLLIDATPVHREGEGWERNQLSMFSFSHLNNRHRRRISDSFRSAWISGLPNCGDLESKAPTDGALAASVDRVMPLRPRS